MLFFVQLIGNHDEICELKGVCVGGLELWLPKSETARIPAISYLRQEHADRLSAERLEGYSDLVVEIVTEESVERVRREKFVEYQAAGIPEYWIVDPRPRCQTVDLYVLDAQGQYVALASDSVGRLRSHVLPGFWINPAWLWGNPRPKAYLLSAQIIAEQVASLP